MSLGLMPEELKSEQHLCECFIERMEKQGWVIYPEQEGWDVLMVRGEIQVGVQAKMRIDPYVLCQTVPCFSSFVRPDEHVQGPHYRAVLLPGMGYHKTWKAFRTGLDSLSKLASWMKILVVTADKRSNNWLDYRYNITRKRAKERWYEHRIDWRYYRWYPEKPVWVPPFVPDFPAGVKSPRRIGKWQVAAVRLEMLCLERGWVTLDDARKKRDEVDGKWKAITMLNRYWCNAGQKSPDNPRQNKWIVDRRPRPFEEYPECVNRV